MTFVISCIGYSFLSRFTDFQHSNQALSWVGVTNFTIWRLSIVHRAVLVETSPSGRWLPRYPNRYWYFYCYCKPTIIKRLRKTSSLHRLSQHSSTILTFSNMFNDNRCNQYKSAFRFLGAILKWTSDSLEKDPTWTKIALAHDARLAWFPLHLCIDAVSCNPFKRSLRSLAWKRLQ